MRRKKGMSNHAFTEHSLNLIGFDNCHGYDKALIVKDDFNAH